MSRIRQCGISIWVLAACVLAAGLMPPAVMHSHSASDQPYHSHAADDCHADDAHWHAAHSHAQPGKPCHLHLVFLGFTLTLPVPVSPRTDSPEPGLVDVPVVLVRLIADPLPTQTVEADHWASDTAAACTSDCDCVDVTSGLSRAAPPFTSPFLCDRARRERSGVLLI